MQHVAFVRSPHAHARVRGIKAGAALKRPGVVAVVTGQELKPHVIPIPIAQASAEGGEVSGGAGRAASTTRSRWTGCATWASRWRR